MKHLFLILMLLFAGAFATTVIAAPADNPPQPDEAVYSPDIITTDSLTDAFQTFFALVAFIPLVVHFFRRLILPNATGLTVQIFSWAIGLVVTLVGWILHLGFLDGLSIWLALLYGAGACLAANGVFDTGLITAIFGLFGLKGLTNK